MAKKRGSPTLVLSHLMSISAAPRGRRRHAPSPVVAAEQALTQSASLQIMVVNGYFGAIKGRRALKGRRHAEHRIGLGGSLGVLDVEISSKMLISAEMS